MARPTHRRPPAPPDAGRTRVGRPTPEGCGPRGRCTTGASTIGAEDRFRARLVDPLFGTFTGLACVQPPSPWYAAPRLAIAVLAILTLLPTLTVGFLVTTALLAV